jgi:hypothetical protein
MSRLGRVTADFLSGNCTGFSAPPLTITCWVRFYDLVASQVVCVGTVGSGNNYYGIGLNNSNNVQAIERDTVNSAALTAVAPSQNVWHNLTAVFASHSDRRVYFDGGNKATDTTTRSATATTGIGVLGDPTGNGCWTLDICHVALWNIALSDTDVGQLFTQLPLYVQPANLVEYWPMYGNQSPEPSTKTANSLTVSSAQYSSYDPFYTQPSGNAARQLYVMP